MLTQRWNGDLGRWQRYDTRYVPGTDHSAVDLRAAAADLFVAGEYGLDEPIRVELSTVDDVVAVMETYAPCGRPAPDTAPNLTGSFDGPYPGRMDYRQALTRREIWDAQDRLRPPGTGPLPCEVRPRDNGQFGVFDNVFGLWWEDKAGVWEYTTAADAQAVVDKLHQEMEIVQPYPWAAEGKGDVA